MTPSSKYNEFMQQSGFYPDQAQQHALYLLDRLYENVERNESEQGLITKFVRILGISSKQVRGLYFWGGVGRGKTFLMDIFYEVLPIKNKRRFHYHQFMQQIHDELSITRKGKNPVKEIAKNLARKTKVLCLDEFVVTDIGDAMLIGRLLDALFDEGIILITTSNTPPEELYKDGLQRASFVPAIDLLDQHCQIANLDGGQDYRTLGLKHTKLYQVPHNRAAIEIIENYLNSHLVSVKQHDSLFINGRQINFEFCAEDTVWFSFDELCKTTRSRFDYLEIASLFNTVIITGIEAMNEGTMDVARRFVSLIDVFYDRRVKLICTADVVVEELYQHDFLAFEFTRTVSRLLEMQSLDYIGQTHFV
ncbi:MAG: cell division protein ZapE [Gammaproteobacteria bacterium]|jgi:cell division protein ZapE|nr:cell division protein ZapE [Gammaproteobacteria bacterium]MBT3723867.1 cell division protein ZapE [Gammaproteobacteria bacterium]MBT4076009.1 cell division protein ZapE [Gammaproteobacteria bacterium]MBT4193956.1 cell division protein ZapE [Gammaproteobacteria bacterium]MBT4452343.1 cell division protein ZapE [Gammaproteobacteria bacterium]